MILDGYYSRLCDHIAIRFEQAYSVIEFERQCGSEQRFQGRSEFNHRAFRNTSSSWPGRNHLHRNSNRSGLREKLSELAHTAFCERLRNAGSTCHSFANPFSRCNVRRELCLSTLRVRMHYSGEGRMHEGHH